jgi:hypothetical protein
MSENWYKKQNKKTRRQSLVLAKGEAFLWENDTNIDGSYSVVTARVGDSVCNFYIWSKKTVKTAKNLFEEGDFEKSLNMLKKYSFEANFMEEDEEAEDSKPASE